MGNPSDVPRSAYTLIELLVVLSVISMLITSVSVTIHTLAILNHQLRADGPRSETLTRLSLRMRDDAHTQKSGTSSNRSRSFSAVDPWGSVIVVYESSRNRSCGVIRRPNCPSGFSSAGHSSSGLRRGRTNATADVTPRTADKRISGAKDSVRSNEIVAAARFNTGRK
jgi:prepilin-type N-terminal cleavage/methylation domain-containing protein